MGCCKECPLHKLVSSDYYYREFKKRLKDPKEEDKQGNTLLHVAAQSSKDNSSILQLLIQRGADVNSTNPDGNTPLHFAVASHNHYAVVALLDAEASVNSKDLLGRTALHFSVSKGEIYRLYPVLITDYKLVIETLLSHPKICLNTVDLKGETPLVWAVKEGSIDAIRALLNKGANPNILNADNRNSLHVALSDRSPQYDIAYTLLANGAGIYCVDLSGHTPIDIFVRNALDDPTLIFQLTAVQLIALRYCIRKSLKRKLKQIPVLLEFLNACCIEVELMKKLVIYDNVTLHDFCLDCFQTRVNDPVREIYKPVVEILLSGLFENYYDQILGQLSESDLLGVLRETAGSVNALDQVPPDATCETILSIIKGLYEDNLELKRRLSRLKNLIINI